jgi:hypothetical protein
LKAIRVFKSSIINNQSSTAKAIPKNCRFAHRKSQTYFHNTYNGRKFLRVEKMKNTPERRRERRLRYHWPVWFAEDFNGFLSQGQMVDVSSTGAAFTCFTGGGCPYPGQQITARFSVPLYHPDESFDLTELIRRGYIRRVDRLNAGLCRIAICFFEPLPFKPGEQPHSPPNSHAAEPATA